MVSSSGLATAVVAGLAVAVGGRALFGEANEGAGPQFKTEVEKVTDSFNRDFSIGEQTVNSGSSQGGSQKGPSQTPADAGPSQSQQGPSVSESEQRKRQQGGTSPTPSGTGPQVSTGPVDHGPDDVVDTSGGETFVKGTPSMIEVEKDLATADKGGFVGTPDKDERGIIGGRS